MKAHGQYLRSKDVAHIFDCSPDDVIELAREGKLRAFKEGRFWRFRQADVIAHKKRMEVTVEGETMALFDGLLLEGNRPVLKDLAVSIEAEPHTRRWHAVFSVQARDLKEIGDDVLYTLALEDGRTGLVISDNQNSRLASIKIPVVRKQTLDYPSTPGERRLGWSRMLR
ncbi:MAG: helix-turn-helix domain-containing protein [bacterium]